MNMIRKQCYCIVLLVLFSIACDNAVPVITRFNFEVSSVYNPGTARYAEELAIWISVTDKDGFGDLQEIILRQPEEGLEWKFNNEEWIELATLADRRIGRVKIQGPNPEEIPGGIYEVEVVDGAYNKSSRTFLIAEPDYTPQKLIPQMTHMSANVWNLNSQFTNNYIYTINEAGEIVELTEHAPGRVELSGSYRTNPIYIIVRYRGRALLSGPYYLNTS